MQLQNPHLFKANKANSPAQIQIYQLPNLSPISPPPFSPEAFKPLNLDFYQLKQTFLKSSSNQNPNQDQSLNRKIIVEKQTRLSGNAQFSVLLKQNKTLQSKLEQMYRIQEEQKRKYVQLKNLYKEGEAMFEVLEQKKIILQKENKQLRLILQNLYKQLHKENQNLDSRKLPDRQVGQRKIQKVKIGNKQIPVIKVNVPPETFIKKQHSSSVFSLGCQQQLIQQSKQQINNLKQDNETLAKANNTLIKQLMQLRRQLSQKQNTIKELSSLKIKKNNQQSSGPLSILQQKQNNQRNDIATQSGTNNISSESFQFYLSNSDKQSFLNQNTNSYPSNYKQTENNVSYYRSKYTILETQLKKKDEAIKDLYEQCYMLQSQINMSKASPSKLPQSESFFTNPKSQTKCQTKEGQSDQAYYRNKINQLQCKINQLNQICIANINNSFKMNQLNQTVSRLTKQNFECHQRLVSQQSELKRLYKILQNKNTELSQIYTVITQTKKPGNQFEGSHRKSMVSMFDSTPQKSQNQKQTKRKVIFFQKQFLKDYPTQ